MIQNFFFWKRILCVCVYINNFDRNNLSKSKIFRVSIVNHIKKSLNSFIFFELSKQSTFLSCMQSFLISIFCSTFPPKKNYLHQFYFLFFYFEIYPQLIQTIMDPSNEDNLSHAQPEQRTYLSLLHLYQLTLTGSTRPKSSKVPQSRNKDTQRGGSPPHPSTHDVRQAFQVGLNKISQAETREIV